MPSVALQPAELAQRATTLDRAVFAAAFELDLLLLDQLAGARDALRRALVECPTEAGRTWQPRSEPTNTSTEIKRVLPGRRDLQSYARARDPKEHVAVLRRPHFVMPLRKRAGATAGDPERISVGRSHACDVVLAHGTVSKLHAWLERDDAERLYVTDEHSTNFTRVAGRIVEPESVVCFGLWEEVQFGDVVVRISTPEQLWEALHVAG